jgi:hypothetical protein
MLVPNDIACEATLAVSLIRANPEERPRPSHAPLEAVSDCFGKNEPVEERPKWQ